LVFFKIGTEHKKYVAGLKVNKAKQHQSLRSLDSLVAAQFVRGFATFTQTNHQQACRCWQRYAQVKLG